MKRVLLIVVIFIAGLGSTYGQLSVTNAAPTATINFSNSMQATVGFGAYNGSGFSPTTVAGRLNSNAWETTGWTNGDLLFGGALTNPAHGRGQVAGGVLTEGIYAYTDNPHTAANPALMIQASNGDFAPGTIALKIKNDGTSNITQLEISYNLFVRNDEDRSSSLNFSHSADNIAYEAEAALDYISPELADPFQWLNVGVAPSRYIVISGINVAPGAFYYIRWSCEDVSGTGNRDEFGLDDIVVNANYGAPAPEINVVGGGVPGYTILSGDMTPRTADNTNIGDTYTGGNNTTFAFLMQNLGGLPLHISNITLTGANPGDFLVTSSTTGTIPAASGVVSTQQLDIRFTPQATGTRSAIVNIFSDDANENPYTFRIQGRGVAPIPDIKVYGFTTPTAEIFTNSSTATTATSTLFTPQVIGGAGQTIDYRIKNDGTPGIFLILTGPSPYITISGANPSDFTLVTFPNAANINPGFNKSFSIKFSPTASGIRTALITIANNDPVADLNGNMENNFTFLVQGQGTGPEFDLTGNTQPVISGSTVPAFANHTFYDYQNVATGTIDRTYTIHNTGSSALTVGALTITGSTDFTLVSPPAASVGIGGTSNFTIRFNPSSIGLKSASVSIINNDFNENPYTFNISGYGVDYTPCNYGVIENIALQDFDGATPIWNYTSTGAVSGGTAFALTGDSGLTPKFLGANSLQVTNSTTIVNMAPLDTSDFSDVELSFKLASMATTAANGNDTADRVQIAVSTDGTTWSNELVVSGISESKWAFSATAVASVIYDGDNSAAAFSPSLGGFVTAAGFGTVTISNLPKVANLQIRITLNNNIGEIWAIDNLKLAGRKIISTTWNGSWTNGAPTASTKVIIDSNYSTASGSIQACQCEIKAGRTVTIQPNDYFYIQSDFKNNGIINIENNGSLVQKNDFAVNSGIINVKRYTTAMRRYDYTYWSSPVQGETLFNLSPLTLSDKFFEYNAAGPAWLAIPSSTVMQSGKGYIVRAPQNFDTVATEIYDDGEFTGLTNNGIIQTPIVAGSWNLIGNPYPSAIDADAFLGFGQNEGVIEGSIYLWTHNTPVTANIYVPGDYATYNLTGGQGTRSANLGVNNSIPQGEIVSGQGFFVSGSTTDQVTFNNSMRIATPNTQFFRYANGSNGTSIEKNRIWLNISNADGAFKQTLIGYIEGATNEFDRRFDAEILNSGSTVSIYTTLSDKNLAIQGKRLPFEENDTVPLGYSSNVAGDFTINIENTDGFFTTQNIYLEDKMLNLIHDLKASDYTFNTAVGTFNDRFELRYTDSSLGNEHFTEAANVLVAVKNNTINIQSEKENITAIAVYDLLGRTVLHINGINDIEYAINTLNVSQQAMVMKITLASGRTVNRKIIL